MKRLFDVFCSSVGLFFLSPLLISISAAIKISDGGSVFFVQERIGRNFRPFKLYKFRTMVTDAQKQGLAITAADDPRVTRVGGFLRRSKLDELPQLINVINGDMSLVGPRPEVQKYVQLFEKEYQEILTVRPGMTDYAALEFIDEEEILGSYDNREAAYVEEVLPRKIELYRKYLANQGIGTDISIILKTLFRSFRSRRGSF